MKILQSMQMAHHLAIRELAATALFCSIKVSKRLSKVASQNTTNNRMELMAVLQALKVLKEPCRIKIYTDSQYVAQGING